MPASHLLGNLERFQGPQLTTYRVQKSLSLLQAQIQLVLHRTIIHQLVHRLTLLRSVSNSQPSPNTTVLPERPSTTQNHGCNWIELVRLFPKAREREQWSRKDLPSLDAHALPLSQQEGITQQERCKQSSVWNTLGTDRRTPSTECRRKCAPPLQLSFLRV